MSMVDESEPGAGALASAPDYAGRLLAASLGWIETMSVHVGLQTGWYRALAAAPEGLSVDEVAAATRTQPRYVREWLELQGAFDLLEVRDPTAPAHERRYRLGAGAAEALLDDGSEDFLGPLARMLAACGARMPELIEAYRGGGGVSWSEFGVHARESQAAMNRPWMAKVPEITAADPSLHEMLSRPGAKIADIGCGGGWASIALAQAYPELRVLGVDIDEPTVVMARRNAADAGVGERVEIVAEDATGLRDHGPFDAAFAFECLHDMPQPVSVLRAMREAMAPEGRVIVMDEGVGESYSAPADELERLMYGFSVFLCLPDGLSHPQSVGTGTVMRPETLRGYALDAGFSAVDVLAEDFGLWRFYELKL